MQWREQKFAAALVEIEEWVKAALSAIFIAHELVILESKAGCTILHIIQRLIEWRQLIFIELIEIGTILQQKQAHFLSLLDILIEVAHYQMQRRVAITVHPIEVLLRAEILYFEHILRNFIRESKIMIMQANM